MKILGIWDGHDSGAALLIDGRLVAAVNEERFSRRKLDVCFPRASIAACLQLAGVGPDQIDLVAASTSDVAKAIARIAPSTKEMYYRVRRRQARPGLLSTLCRRAKYRIPELRPNRLSRFIGRRCLRQALDAAGLRRAALRIYDHHECHAAAAVGASGFDRCLAITIDGVGDGVSSTVAVSDGRRLTRLAATPAKHSPGIFFEHVTNLMNMRELEDEGKVMALAGHAAVPAENVLTALLQARGLRFWTAASGYALYVQLRRLQWHYPNEQFARMAQETLELACVAVVREAVRQTGIRKVTLAGGVASNIKMNRLVRMLDGVDELFVFPHMGDGGLAFGAAVKAANASGHFYSAPLGDLGLGPGFQDEEIHDVLEDAGFEYQRPASLAQAVSAQLLQDRIVMWFQGRMEYGPRALGHRSILARADSPEVRDRLNLALKRRVWYQPFCPSILESDARRVFSDWKGPPNRHMTTAYTVRAEFAPALAGVISPDRTCRPQIVDDGCSSEFAALLRELQRRTGVGVLLNTSFNIHGEPLVCTPHEAVSVFCSSEADALAIGPALVLGRRLASSAEGATAFGVVVA